ncbi:DUF5692 family protein, partial [Vibrio metschnikovii]|uniref:DUF5692 family protein n=1 Tax=Vibrio metschnikovii TaxID=28172 RepID=UPI002FCB5D08
CTCFFRHGKSRYLGERLPFNVAPSYNPMANWSISLLSLVLNLYLASWQLRRILLKRLNPMRDEIFSDQEEYKSINAYRQ